jgi:hypothetical protein
MRIEFLKTQHPARARYPSDVENHLVDLDGRTHDSLAAEVCCAASVWAFSDLRTFASVLCQRDLYGEFLSINVKNDPAFVNTTAFMFLSESKQLAILAFRGVEPLNIINCLAAINTRLVREDAGKVHDGFFTAGRPVLLILRHLLLSWATATSPRKLEDSLWELVDQSCVPAAVIEEALWSWRPSHSGPEESVSPRIGGPKPALYLCGHSMGGALAGLAGAMLLHPDLESCRDKLRSIYTFGAPMFADTAYAKVLERELGERVFLHRYGKDMIPLLPGRHRGDFKHFGHRYRNSEQGTWVPSVGRIRKVDQVTWSAIVVFIGFLAWFKEIAAVFPNLPLPYSFPDHYPLRYLRASQGAQAGRDSWAGDREEPSIDVHEHKKA